MIFKAIKLAVATKIQKSKFENEAIMADIGEHHEWIHKDRGYKKFLVSFIFSRYPISEYANLVVLFISLH